MNYRWRKATLGCEKTELLHLEAKFGASSRRVRWPLTVTHSACETLLVRRSRDRKGVESAQTGCTPSGLGGHGNVYRFCDDASEFSFDGRRFTMRTKARRSERTPAF